MYAMISFGELAVRTSGLKSCFVTYFITFFAESCDILVDWYASWERPRGRVAKRAEFGGNCVDGRKRAQVATVVEFGEDV